MGITWPLLLSLSFLLHRVTSADAPSTTSISPTTKVIAVDPMAVVTSAGLTNTQTVMQTPAIITTAMAEEAAKAAATVAVTTATITAPHEANSPTGAAAIAHEQVTTTLSVASQVSSASSTVANLAMVTGATVRPTTLNPLDKSTDPTKEFGTSKPVEHSTLPHTEGSSMQPTTAVVTPSTSNVFQTPVGTEQTSTTLTNAAAGGSGTYTIEMISTTLIMPTTTKRSQQEPKVTSGPGTTRSPSDLNTPTPTPVVLTSTRDEPLDTSSVTTPTMPTKNGPAEPQLKTFEFSLKSKNEEQREFVEVCKRLMVNMEDGMCILKWQNDSNKVQFQSVEISGTVKLTLANQYHDELTKKPTDNTTLIAILASCGTLLIMIIILAVCASHHRKPYNETQQHLTEELHTVENGYHDNPTLEVMEVQPEMQEKKMTLNGEFNDSWIVPIDNLLKEDVPDEEDTHL